MAGELSWGDIRLVDLDKRRPALVLTRTVVIPRVNVITVAPITSVIRGIATEVRVGDQNGLKQDSVVTLDHLITVRKEQVGRWLGAIGEERKAEIREALAFAYELDDDSML